MKIDKVKTIMLAVTGAAILQGTPAAADAPKPASGAEANTEANTEGWDEFVEGIRTLPQRMLAKLPAERRADPQIRQEIGRLALAAVTSSALQALGSDQAHPVFLPTIGQVLSVGQPNADTSYRIARVSPEGTYRLRGKRGSLKMFNISQSPPTPGDPDFDPATAGKVGARPRNDFNDLSVDAEGRFDVILSGERPQGHTGAWWKLEPTTSMLLLRMVRADWSAAEEPTISIERLDQPVARSRPSAADLEGRLRNLPHAASFIGPLFPDRVEKMRQRGIINKLEAVDMSELGGLTRQDFYEGSYDLAEDEALIIATKVPKNCGYRSVILTNYIYETTDWYNNQSSLNNEQAQPDSDGVLRIVVSTRDPGVPNWLDTAGYPQGAIQGRWESCDTQPTPSVRKVKVSQVRNHLPAETSTITPEERERIVRERRASLQQRPLW